MGQEDDGAGCCAGVKYGIHTPVQTHQNGEQNGAVNGSSHTHIEQEHQQDTGNHDQQEENGL